ncbi:MULTISPECIES: FGGY-family carbohydrate kinase [unclassified Oleiphilus]|jgi:sugar (pentulose or hexulose) kinase|nr:MULTISPECIES: FGGY-family carbohydrate kinase [unclassified Oleiphilus]KZY50356.1 carbohydrate kinase [Oleiphilus sp. HI0050]KZY75395.1 carbohydrate kinase [Oleiphilus sp. HI0069]KZY89090.1 carbohydrate kinase [Oleiphilus sp. HI0072]KZZ29821.1 carbohydrate kinase [Oleiphilus sp. HI0081]KZZ34420.1 carbohydrate kinase [Oleiphilus sp. HI0085]
MSEQYIFTIDNGTQSVRAIIFDTQGNLIAKGKQELEPYFSSQPGWAEQDPEYYWSSLKKACDKLWAAADIDRSRIIAATVTTQRGTVVNVDEQGRPVRPAIVWLDQRRAEVKGDVPGFWKWLFKIAGVEDVVHRFREKSQALWISQSQPEIWRKTHKFLLLSGYLSFKLTGEFKDSVGAQVGYIPFDYKKLKWAAESDWRFKILPSLCKDMLPELVDPGESLGALTKEAATHLGLDEGLPIIASASDKACEIIGSGGNRPDIACMSYGTTATINTTNSKHIGPIKYMPAYPAAIPKYFSSEIMIYRGFWMVSWFKKEFGLREQKIAEERGIEPEQLFDELVNQVPAGSMGLMLQPYWSPGVRDPGPEAKGGIIGFGDVHTRSHIYRAILEGLAYGLKEGMQRLEKRNGLKVKTLRVSGGGSQSDAAMQLTADVFGMPAERPHTYETSGLGAAIDVAVGLGVYASFDEAIENMARVGKVFQPNPERVKLYARLYKEVYLKMYPQLQPLYKTIRDITGYPE